MKLGKCYIWYIVVMSVFVRPSVRKIIIHNCITNLFIEENLALQPTPLPPFLSLFLYPPIF